MEATLLYGSPLAGTTSARASAVLKRIILNPLILHLLNPYSAVILYPLILIPLLLGSPLDHHLSLTDDLAVRDENVDVGSIRKWNTILIHWVPGTSAWKAR